MDQLDLSDFFKTKGEAVDFSSRLSDISDKAYQTDFDLSRLLTASLGVTKKEKFIKLLRENNVSEGSKNKLIGFFNRIQEQIAAIAVITMTVAIEPPEEIMTELAQWFLTNINRQVLFDIRVDPVLAGGATISFNGKFKDYTIRPVFDKYLQEILDKKPTANQ